MWKCSDCDEYFDEPVFLEFMNGTIICPYCGCSDLIFYDEDKGREMEC